jgi:autotransporter beta-domain protein
MEGRRLALMIGIAVSGAVLFPQYTAAADVTGHDIVSSRDWTGPDTNPRTAGYIGSADGNVYGNTLTVNSTHRPPHALDQGYIAAGYTEGGGDTYGNRLVILPGAHLTGRVSGGHLDGAALSGRTHHNTVIMRGGTVTDDSYMGDGTHGSGDLSYLGTGVLARMDRTNGAWMEAVLHGGSTKANYRGQVYASRLTTYRYTAPYWAMQLGVGKTRTVGRAAQLDCYVRYFWSHTNGASARLNSGETYDFHATDSHRLRAGARYTRRNSASALYAGLALEYEMGNGAAAHFQSYEMPASGAAGVSALMELGWRSAPKHGRVTCEVNLSGWQGRRSGWLGSAYIDWKL